MQLKPSLNGIQWCITRGICGTTRRMTHSQEGGGGTSKTTTDANRPFYKGKHGLLARLVQRYTRACQLSQFHGTSVTEYLSNQGLQLL